jgi:hypothetical protein
LQKHHKEFNILYILYILYKMPNFSVRNGSTFSNRVKVVGEQPAFNAEQLFDTAIDSDLFTVMNGDVLSWDGVAEHWTAVPANFTGITGPTGATGAFSGPIIAFAPSSLVTTGLNITRQFGNMIVVNLELQPIVPLTGPTEYNLGAFATGPAGGFPALAISIPSLASGTFLMEASIFSTDNSLRFKPATGFTAPVSVGLSFEGVYSLL